MSQHAFEFFVIQQTKNSMSYCNGGVTGIAAGGESVGRFRRDHVDLRHRNAHFLREALDDDPKIPRFIETSHRRGYRFVAPIDWI